MEQFEGYETTAAEKLTYEIIIILLFLLFLFNREIHRDCFSFHRRQKGIN